MLGICLTFDYELFFGSNKSTDEEILFNPTKKLIEMLNEEDISATFFVDTCSVLQHKRYNISKYVEKFSSQICDMIKAKQDVQLHIHPHWLNSKYNNGNWQFDQTGYRLHSFFSKENNSCVDGNYIIKWGINYLNDTITRIKPDYMCMAYRAGGFCIQPHPEIVKMLYDNGIRIDSSIAPKLFSSNLTNGYDFRHKTRKTNWFLSCHCDNWWDDGEKTNGSLFEIPIATINKNIISFLFRRIFTPGTIKLDIGEKKGTYINTEVDKKNRLASLIHVYRYICGYNAISLDNYQADYLYELVKKYYNRYNCTKQDCYIALIGHPKLISREYLINLKRFIKLLKCSDLDIEVLNIVSAYKKVWEN